MLLPAETAALFHVPGLGPYLAAHAAGCQPRCAAKRLVDAMLAPWARDGNAAWGRWLDAIGDFRAALAALIGCDMSAICPQPNVSAGFARWLAALPPPAGDRREILLAPSAFPSLAYVAQGAERLGYRLAFLPEADDVRDAAAWRASITERTAVVLAMHVTSNSGALSPVADIVAIAHAAGARAAVDIAQSVGIIPMTIADWRADAVIGSCLKWLCGGPGAGFILLRPDDIATLDPLDKAWWSHAEPFAMDIRDFRPAPDATRLWGGTPDIAPFVLATAGIDTVAGIGVGAIRAHNQAMQAMARQAFGHRTGWRWPAGEIGGTLCIDVGSDRARVEAALTAMGAQADFRGSVMRLSFAAWNGPDDVEQVARAVLTA